MPLWSSIDPQHFANGRYFNPGAPQARGFSDLLRWKLHSRAETSPDWIEDVIPYRPPERVERGRGRITIVNHSTLLLQFDGTNLLTDPIWSTHAGPFGRMGPRRRRAPGVRLEDLPPLDAVLLSHNHYDHLDLPTLRRLKDRGVGRIVAPKGCATHLRKSGIGPVDELDWGGSGTVPGACIHCLPALHFSARTPFDRNRTLWCGYWIESSSGGLYFAADTGFGPHFDAIRRRFGPPRAAMLPIGAYLPRWFMSPVHMGPEDALAAHDILQAQVSIAIHHGTFQLADDGIDTPRLRIGEMARTEAFLAPPNGGGYEW